MHYVCSEAQVLAITRVCVYVCTYSTHTRIMIYTVQILVCTPTFGISVGFRWDFGGISVGFRWWDHARITVGFRWDFGGISVGFRWDFGGISVDFGGITLGSRWDHVEERPSNLGIRGQRARTWFLRRSQGTRFYAPNLPRIPGPSVKCLQVSGRGISTRVEVNNRVAQPEVVHRQPEY
jgi:hypothetical protein